MTVQNRKNEIPVSPNYVLNSLFEENKLGSTKTASEY